MSKSKKKETQVKSEEDTSDEEESEESGSEESSEEESEEEEEEEAPKVKVFFTLCYDDFSMLNVLVAAHLFKMHGRCNWSIQCFVPVSVESFFTN